ncbi:MAG TPA: hypothetical protein VJL89_13715, partial [Thermodesulfovibrionia bacterium]|nr:hypothetical protein [Thermodesulfovibrionia bacterium]
MKKLLIISLVFALFSGIGQVGQADQTYTTTADFNSGNIINLNEIPADQLQVNTVVVPLPFINVSVSTQGILAR